FSDDGVLNHSNRVIGIPVCSDNCFRVPNIINFSFLYSAYICAYLPICSNVYPLSLPSYKYRSKVCLDTLIWSANIFVLPVDWYIPSKYISYTLVLFFVTVLTLQLDQLIYEKLGFIQ